MKRFLQSLLGLGLIGVSMYRWPPGFLRRPAIVVRYVEAVRTSGIEKSSPKSLIELLPEAPIIPGKLVSADSGPATAHACDQDWLTFVQTDNRVLQSDLEAQRLIFSTACLDEMNQENRPWPMLRFVRNCQLQLADLDPHAVGAACFPQLSAVRALIIHSLVTRGLLSEEDPSLLTHLLVGGMLQLGEASLEEVQRTLAIAEGALEQDPSLYAAYKAKLFSKLVLELKYREAIEEEVYDQLFTELARFDLGGGGAGILRELSLAQGEESFLLETSAEWHEIDSDLLQVPFLRLKALENYEALGALAEEYTQAFPGSHVGIFYQAEALWGMDRKAEAVSLLHSLMRPEMAEEMSLDILQTIFDKPALERLLDIESRLL
jgi:hypothetical protein